jgi:ATP phosphoribosyltransferase regulatory subunit HisZ
VSLFDSILKNIAGSPDDVANLAAKVGIDPGIAEKAIAALGQSHQMQGDTVELAAAKTGLDTGTLSQIVEQIGGEGSLMEFANTLKDHPQAASILQALDRDHDGNPLNDIAGMASGLFGKK